MLHAIKRCLEAVVDAIRLDDFDVALDLLYAIDLIKEQATNYRAYNMHASNTYFLRPDLLWPEEAPWAQIRRRHSDMALINFIRVDWPTFDRIMAHIDADAIAWREGFTDATRSARRPGRPTMLDTPDVVALTLAYLTSTSSQKQLEMLFGIGHTLVSVAIWEEGFPLLLTAFDRMREAAIEWPSYAEQTSNADLVDATYGPCPITGYGRVFGFMDGLRLRCTSASNAGVQNLFYSGYERHTNVVNNIVFDPKGRIIDAVINNPGSFNDYTLAESVYTKLMDHRWTRPGYVIAADNGYISNVTKPILAHLDYQPLGVFVTQDQRRLYTSWQLTVRKAAEWGMHILQSLFPRLTVPMPGSLDKRKAIITLCLKLNNIISSCMEHRNQIKTVYMGALRHDWDAAQVWAEQWAANME